MHNRIQLNVVPEIHSVQEMVLRSTSVFHQKLALEDLRQTPLPRLTYSELLTHILKFGTALQKLGVKRRNHVAIVAENRIQWALSYLTCMCFDFVACPVDRNLPTNDILNILHESDSVAVIYSDQFEPVLSESKKSLKHLQWYINMDLPARRGGSYSMMELIERSPGCTTNSLPKIKPAEMAEIIFTSGSLGRAKGVMLSQRNLASNLVAMVSAVLIKPEDRFLSILPMHHSYECTCGLLCPLYTGASVHYARSLKTVVEDLQASRATVLLGVPLLYDKMFKRIYKSIQEKKIVSLLIKPLVQVTNILEKIGWKSSKRTVFHEIHARFGGSIRLFLSGGAASDPMVAKGLREFGFALLQGYGLTETSPIIALNTVQFFKDNAAGIPLPGVQIKIQNPDHEGMGEILAKGPNIMLGYYKNEKATHDVLHDGWFKTGDLGFLDDDGFVHIAGRLKNVIISKRGENVYPEELEDLLSRSPFVLECMVYGENDPKHGEVIAVQILPDAEAFIELSETTDTPITDELMREILSKEIAKVNAKVASFKQITRMYLREQEFDKTTTQKVKRYLVSKNAHSVATQLME
jgi:long-chain acyl-CoA synthetase